MNTLFIIINMIVMVLFIFLLFQMQKKHVSFSKRVFLALGLGIVFGITIHLIYGTTSVVTQSSIEWFNIIGSGYVKLLQMIVMPLVFISIVTAFTKLKLTNNIGKISILIIGILIGTTAIAAAIGITTTLVFDLEAIELEEGDAETARNEELEESIADVEEMTIPQQIIELLPGNPFLDLTGARSTSTIAVVIFASIIGIAYLGVITSLKKLPFSQK